MLQKQYLEKFRERLEEAYKLTRAKNSDYAKEADAFANFTQAEKLGVCTTEQGILVRMSDKLQRAVNLLSKGPDVKSESMNDTLMDLAVYALILSIYVEWKGQQINNPEVMVATFKRALSK
ncbi:hypothetical protein M0R04_06520 [Candidatus Dojkabacteria bacterium]|jgi:hypothetical protein|nr:hypothetical protein [Candidatus Dojkabacteria bacterium]